MKFCKDFLFVFCFFRTCLLGVFFCVFFFLGGGGVDVVFWGRRGLFVVF